MKVFLVLCSLAALALAEDDVLTLQEYYRNETIDESVVRIIGGSAASAGQFPYQVAVNYRTSAGSYFCGGSLISDRWVLTAAHCVRGAISFTLYFGGITLSSSESGRVTQTATRFIEHPSYNANNLNNDIALIQLDTAVTLNSRIQTIQLPSDGSTATPASRSVTVSGWGRTSDSSNSVSNTLNWVTLQTISNTQCAQVYGSSVVISSTICAVGNPHHSTCSGDSGGPLVDNSSGTTIQVGVVSFVNRAGCASGNPSGYVRTLPYLSWIRQYVSGV